MLVDMTYHRRAVGPKFNEGARLLWLALAKDKESINDVEEKTGSASGTGSRWLYGDTKPMTPARFEIESLWGVPVRSWDDAPTEPFVVPALRDTEPPDELGGVVVEKAG